MSVGSTAAPFHYERPAPVAGSGRDSVGQCRAFQIYATGTLVRPVLALAYRRQGKPGHKPLLPRSLQSPGSGNGTHTIGASALALSLFGILGTAQAQMPAAAQPDAGSAGTTYGAPSAFGPLKHVNAGLLDVAYAETGPADGPLVILLHGWPYDIHSYDEVAPLLAAKGYRVLMPYARGYGDTRFLSAKTLRNGQPAALASDVIDFMDALKIKQAVLGGYDWGARSADIVSALWPERVKALVSVSGDLIGNQAAGQNPLPPKAELQWWYPFYFATDRGRAGYEKNTHDFAKLIWQLASPQWKFDDATFERSAKALDNPDHVDITMFNYR